MMTREMLTREQQAVLGFSQATAPLRTLASEFRGEGLSKVTSKILDSLAFFGESELYARQAERCVILKIHPDRSKFLIKQSSRLTEMGVESLVQANEDLGLLRQDIASYPKNVKLSNNLREFHNELREMLVDLEIKPSDVQQVDQAISQCLEFVRAKGATNLPDYLEHKIKELSKLRQQPDRGAKDNIPLWKVVAIGLAVGLSVIGLFHCNVLGCSLSSRNSYIAGVAVLALIALFC